LLDPSCIHEIKLAIIDYDRILLSALDILKLNVIILTHSYLIIYPKYLSPGFYHAYS